MIVSRAVVSVQDLAARTFTEVRAWTGSRPRHPAIPWIG